MVATVVAVVAVVAAVVVTQLHKLEPSRRIEQASKIHIVPTRSLDLIIWYGLDRLYPVQIPLPHVAIAHQSFLTIPDSGQPHRPRKKIEDKD